MIDKNDQPASDAYESSVRIGQLTQDGTRVVIAKPVARDQESSSSFGLGTVLHALRRRWKTALPLAILLAAGGAALAWQNYVPWYTARCVLRIDAENAPLIFRTADQTGSRGSNFDLYKKTQRDLITTPFVLSAALATEEIAGLPTLREQACSLSQF